MDLKDIGRYAFLAFLLLLVLTVILGPRHNGALEVLAICFLLVNGALLAWFVQRRRHL